MNNWLGRQVLVTEEGRKVIAQETFPTWNEADRWLDLRRTITAMKLTQWDSDEHRYELRMI